VLQRARTDIKKPIEKLEVYRSKHAHVKSDNQQKQSVPLDRELACHQSRLWLMMFSSRENILRASRPCRTAWFGFSPKASPSRVCPSMSLASQRLHSFSR